MSDRAMWSNKKERTKLFIQRLGPGTPLEPVDAETDVDGPSGGDVSFTTEWSGRQYMRRRRSANPSDVTFNINTRKRYTKSTLRELGRNHKLFTLYLATEVAGLDITVSQTIMLFADVSVPPPGSDKPLLADTTGDETTPMEQFSATAGTWDEVRRTVHNQSSVTTVNAGINHVIWISEDDLEAIAVGDAVSPATGPKLYHYKVNDDGSITFHTLALTGITNGVAEHVTVYGDNVIIAVTGTSAGAWRVSLAAVRAATSSVTATLVSGISSGTAVNDVKAIGKYVFAVGDSGVIWISRNGGFSFSQLGIASGTPNLKRIGGVSDKDVWFVGASGTVVNYYLESSLTTLTPSVVTGDSLTAVAVPDRESSDSTVRRWVYIGSATGEVWYSKDAGVSWIQSRFPGDNSGTIADIQFAGIKGTIMGILHTSASPDSRLLIDYSGGAGGFTVRNVSTPTNTGINSLAFFDVNQALTVGEAVSNLGFIGELVG